MRPFGVLAVAFVLTSCGLRAPGPETPQPSLTPRRSLVTGLEAISIARRKVPTATGVVRLTASFPRPAGTAEFWSVLLSDPASPSAFSEVSIQGKEPVESHGSEGPAGAVVAGFEVLRHDTSQAVRVVRRLDWASRAVYEVLVNPIALDMSGEGAPQEVTGRPAWHLIVTEETERGPRLVGSAWISAEGGSVLATRRA